MTSHLSLVCLSKQHLLIFIKLSLQLISQNQERFIGMLNEPVTGEEAVTEGGEVTGQPEGGPQVQTGSGVNYISVTPQEKEAIERVSRFAFICTPC